MWPFEGEREKLLEVWPHQDEFLQLAKTFPICAIHGSVQNGKSRAVDLASVQHMLGPNQPPDHVELTGWICVPTRQPYWYRIQPEIERVWGWARDGGLILDRNDTLGRYVLKGIGKRVWTWWVQDVDDPEKLRTSPLACIIGTEAAMWKPAVYARCQARLAKSGGPMFLDTSPQGLGWFWREVLEKAAVTIDYRSTRTGGEAMRFERTENFDKRVAVVRGVTIETNRLMPVEAIKLMRQHASRNESRREYDGEDFAESGLVWGSFDPTRHITRSVEPGEFDSSKGQWEVISGHDFGWGHPEAHVWVATDGKRYWVVGEYRESHRTLEAHSAALKESPWHKWMRWCYGDPSGQQAMAEMLDYGIAMQDAENDVELGINRVAQLFESGRLRIAENCTKLIEEIGSYRRNDKTGKPVMLGDDLCCALRYAIATHAMHNDGKSLPYGEPSRFKGGRLQVLTDDGPVDEYAELGMSERFEDANKEVV